LRIVTESLSIESVWTGLTNPELDSRQVEDGAEGISAHPSTTLKAQGPDAWSTVRIDGRDWGRVLSVGRLGGRVIACWCTLLLFKIYALIQHLTGFADEHALILYVYLQTYDDTEEESVLTVSILPLHPNSMVLITLQYYITSFSQ
jgi:HUS1 checkpoint protein